MVGQTLGPFRIVEKLGEGGMGEVYRARDTRLDRDVAIKVLAASAAWSPEARARFEREAKAISQLSHPHICALFDVGGVTGAAAGSTDETPYLVLEYLEGETLAERLKQGPLPLAQALTLGAQIADALETAHRRGIVHRDLKPGNVMLVRKGSGRTEAVHAKLLDFGLAKALPSPTVTSGLEPTITSPAPITREGTFLGTALYMSPEQIEGEEADARSDVWALGCVLFEMLTGRRAFDGKSQASVVAAILEREPAALTTLAPQVSPALAHVVMRCLAKDRHERWQSAGDVKREWQWATQQTSVAPETASPAPQRPTPTGVRWREWAGWTVAAVAVVASIALWRKPPPQVSAATPPGCEVFEGVWRYVSAEVQGYWIVKDGYGVEFASQRGSPGYQGSTWRYLSCTGTQARMVTLDANLPADTQMRVGQETVDEYRIEGDVLVWQHYRPDGTLTPEARSVRVQ